MVTPMPPQSQPTNGVALVTRAQIEGLRDRHRVTLVTVAGPDPAELAAVDELRAEGIEVLAVRRTEPAGWGRWRRRFRFAGALAQGAYPFRTIWFWEPELQRILDRLLAERQFDLIQLDDNAVGIYHYPAAAPTVLVEHEVREPRPPNWQGLAVAGWQRWVLDELDRQRWPRYQQQVWRRFDRVLVFTPHDAAVAAVVAPALANRIRVTPFGIVLPTAADPQREQPGTIVFAGGFSHPPNVDAALWLGHEMMPLLRRLHPGVRLALVGSYPPPEVEALARDDIAVTGRVPEIEPYLEQAAVVLAPVRLGGGMRTKVLQGMGMGKAVVTTPLGAAGLIGPAEPPLVIAADASAFARETARLLNSDGERRALGRRARTFVAEHYSAAAYARRLESVYAELCSQFGECQTCGFEQRRLSL